MASPYNLVKLEAEDLCGEKLGLPVTEMLGGEEFVLDVWNETDVNELYGMFEDVIHEGQTYPQTSTSLDEFRSYWLSHHAFVVRNSAGQVAGSFYIKPNFPGRSSHLANYGLLVNKAFRGRGIGNLMVCHCIRLANRIGFRALYTNLVYVSNVASIVLCKKYNFIQVGCVPNAGNLKGLGFTDALQFYRDVTTDHDQHSST